MYVYRLEIDAPYGKRSEDKLLLAESLVEALEQASASEVLPVGYQLKLTKMGEVGV